MDHVPEAATPVLNHGDYRLGNVLCQDGHLTGVLDWELAHFGDRLGRKRMFTLSVFLMSVPTLLIGLLPTHAQIGVAAPILLLLLRVAQGIGLGGEWGGAVLMAVEHAPEGRRGFYGSLPQTGVGAGLVLSSLAMAAGF